MAKKQKVGIGYRVGKLTVLSETSQRKNGYKVWKCWCDCGGEILLDTRCLQRGTVKNCGCESAVNPGQKDLTGERFGRLVCLEPTSDRGTGGGTIWRCKCDCGNECLAVSTQLTHGYKKSCGCLGHSAGKDLAGRRFGKLTVIERAGMKDGVSYWRCKCDCGRETVVRHANLISGHTKSCGCLQRERILDNLRLAEGTSVTILEATKRRLLASNTSGYNGVYRNKQTKKWAAQITFKGKTFFLGDYDRIEDAVKIRRRGEEMHDSFLEKYYAEHPDLVKP